jgi:ribosome maturation factor RimP
VTLKEIVEQTVAGLGYDLVEIERSAGGLLRITIDLPWSPEAALVTVEQFVTVEDCEKVTRQLQFTLEVDGIEYKRLEVSSPGIDRLLRHENDFQRFVGQTIDLVLLAPVGAAASAEVNVKRKKFRGTLERVEDPAVAVSAAEGVAQAERKNWRIVWNDEPKIKPGQRVSKKRLPAPQQALKFALSGLREARLAPIVNFKGRGSRADTETNLD